MQKGGISLKLKITKKQLIEHIFLLAFILIFVSAFQHFFGSESIFIAAFSVTALLMFSSISLQLPRRLCCLIFPILFILSVLLPYLINIAHNVFIGSLIIIISVLIFLFFLGPSLQFQSYVPFLFLYALNINSPVEDAPEMIVASFIGGLIVSLVYFLSHKDNQTYSLHEILLTEFKNHFPFIIKVIVGMVIAYIIGFYLNDLKTSWIVVTVVSITELDIQSTKVKLWQRIIATIIGISVYSVFLYYIMDHFPTIVPLLLILISYIYTFLNNYFVKMIFVTFNSLNAAIATDHFPTVQMISSRMIFIIIGAAIVIVISLLFNHFYDKYQKEHYGTQKKVVASSGTASIPTNSSLTEDTNKINDQQDKKEEKVQDKKEEKV